MSEVGKSLDVAPPDEEAALVGREGHLRDREAEASHKVRSAELLFDLAFVLAVTRLAAVLAEDPTPEGAVRTPVLLGAVWWLWMITTRATNRLDPDGAVVRLVAIALMAARLVLSACLRGPGPRGRAALRADAGRAHAVLGLGHPRRGRPRRVAPPPAPSRVVRRLRPAVDRGRAG